MAFIDNGKTQFGAVTPQKRQLTHIKVALIALKTKHGAKKIEAPTVDTLQAEVDALRTLLIDTIDQLILSGAL